MSLSFKRNRLFFIFILLLITILYSCGTKKTNGELAKFNGGNVTQDEYVTTYMNSVGYKPDAVPLLDNLKEIVRKIATKKMIIIEAKKENVAEDSTYLKVVKPLENRSLYRAYMIALEKTIITDSLVQKFYQEYSPQYEMKYILRVTDKNKVSSEFQQQSKDTINLVYDKLLNGADFSEMAKKYSQDFRTKEKGGNLGYKVVESFGDKAIREAMAQLAPNSFSKPVKGLVGYYILYKGKGYKVPVPHFEEIKGQIIQSLKKTRKYELDKKVDAIIEQYEEKLNFTIDEKVLEDIKKIGGWKKGISDSERLSFNKISKSDLAKVFARYDGGTIQVFELFPSNGRRPRDEWEFIKNVDGIKKVNLIAQKAKDSGFINFPEVVSKLENVRNSVSSEVLFDIKVNREVNKVVDSLKTNSDLTEVQLRKKTKNLSTSYRKQFEKSIQEKYNFEYITENLETALEEAAFRKVSREKKLKKN